MKPTPNSTWYSRLQPQSLRARLLWGLLLPITAVLALNTYSLYHKALEMANVAYDRTLLATAKTIGEQISAEGYDEEVTLHASIHYSSMEAFESDTLSTIYYKVSDLRGRFVSGFHDLPTWRGRIPQKTRYAALVDFYDAQYLNQEVRMSVLLQPVASAQGRGMAVIQVAETLQLRRALAQEILQATLIRQMILLLVVAALVFVVVELTTQPVRRLGLQIAQRDSQDLSAVSSEALSTELRPIIDATNSVMQRLRELILHQKRFVRDAAHQLRTPLAVLSAQVQSGVRGDSPAESIFQEMSHTIQSATNLTNQMLNLAKVEQLKNQIIGAPWDWAGILREVCLELAPLIAAKDLQFDSLWDTPHAWVLAHEWMLRELSHNLVHNAIKYTPAHGLLSIRLQARAQQFTLHLYNDALQAAPSLPSTDQALHPFAQSSHTAPHTPSGLGLVICAEIVKSLGGSIHLESTPQPVSPGQAPYQVHCTVILPQAV